MKGVSREAKTALIAHRLQIARGKPDEDGIKGKRWFDFDPDTSVNKREMR